jgi:hypothetical protein
MIAGTELDFIDNIKGRRLACVRRRPFRCRGVARWRNGRARFVRDRLDGLSDEPRPPAAHVTDDSDRARRGHHAGDHARERTHWSTRSLAAQTGMTQHRADTFKISEYP